MYVQYYVIRATVRVVLRLCTKHFLISSVVSGGYGKVYKGWDSNFNRHVALKYMDHQPEKGIAQATLREG